MSIPATKKTTKKKNIPKKMYSTTLLSKSINWTKILGNTLIVFAISGIIFTYGPFIWILLFPPKPNLTTGQKNSFSISIPKINAEAPVIPNVDPFNEYSYREALTHGVAHARGTGLPGEGKTIFLFAHSSDAPWRLTRYNTIFLRLGNLVEGDEIAITYKSKVYEYLVVEKKEVAPNAVEYLTRTSDNRLILQTCAPIGTSLMRLLIFAKPKI